MLRLFVLDAFHDFGAELLVRAGTRERLKLAPLLGEEALPTVGKVGVFAAGEKLNLLCGAGVIEYVPAPSCGN